MLGAAGDVLGFGATALGAIFQMPTVVLFLARMGVVTARFLIRKMKYAVLIIFIAAAIIARLTRSAMLETLSLDYIVTARSKGLGERVVVAVAAQVDLVVAGVDVPFRPDQERAVGPAPVLAHPAAPDQRRGCMEQSDHHISRDAASRCRSPS